MNYSRHRIAAKKKLEAHKQALDKMSGEDRTKMEEHLIGEAKKEIEAEDKKAEPKEIEPQAEKEVEPAPKQKHNQNKK